MKKAEKIVKYIALAGTMVLIAGFASPFFGMSNMTATGIVACGGGFLGLAMLVGFVLLWLQNRDQFK